MDFTYRGLTARLERHIVTEEEILRSLHQLQQQNPRIAVIKDRAAALGDEVVLDYAGFCDGEQFAGGTAQNQTLVLGSGMFIPGFEEQLVDKVPEEKVTVKVTFPKEYHAANLAGKDAEFHCTIREIRVKTSYELDDVFAKEVGGCSTLEEMKAKMGESMQAYTDERAEMDLQDRLLRQASETLGFDPTESQIQCELDAQLQNLSAQLARQGLNLDMYCQFMGTTREKLREDARGAAIQSVRVQAAVEQIVAIENLEATEEEIAQAKEVIARNNGMTEEQLEEYCDAEFLHAVIRSILSAKVMKLIRDTAIIEQ